MTTQQSDFSMAPGHLATSRWQPGLSPGPTTFHNINQSNVSSVARFLAAQCADNVVRLQQLTLATKLLTPGWSMNGVDAEIAVINVMLFFANFKIKSLL